MKKQEIKENSVGILSFLLIWVFFYAELLQGGIATHDELYGIAECIKGSNNLIIVAARWGMNLFHYPLNLLQINMPNYALYRLWTIIALMIACLSIMVVIYRHIDRMLCWIFPVVFVFLAQVEFDHDGLLAFGWGYQLDIAMVFISIECFIMYKKTEKKMYKWCSAVAYIVSVMAYEAFAAFGALLFLLDIIYMNDKKNVKVKELVSDLLIHFLLVLSYTLSFVILSRFYDAGDAAIGNETSIIAFLQTLKSYSIGLFPLRYSPYGFTKLLQLAFDISLENLAIWLIIIFFTQNIMNYLKKSKKISFKTYIAYSMISLSGVILPNIVISLTSKFQSWTLLGIKTFGTSYYSYFFLVFWLIITVVFVYNKIKVQKIFTWAIFLVFVFTARFTLSANDYYLEEMNKNQNRYEAFMDIINSEYFKALPENILIYTDDYRGIHQNIDSLSDLATSVSGKQVRFLNDKTQLDWDGSVYYLKYDSNIAGVYLFEMINDTDADNVYIQAENNLNNYYCMFRINSDEALPVYVDEALMGPYRVNAVTSTLYTESNNVIIRNNKMDTESFEIQLGQNAFDSSIIWFDGIYGLEDWGRWSQRDFVFIIDNVNNEADCKINVLLAAGVLQDTELTVQYNGICEQYEVLADGSELWIPISLTPGINQIKFSSEIENLEAPGDNRNLNMRIFKLNISYNGNVFEYCK